ncbi:cell wall metabolism sensor histidine kinase WalK [Streptomyces sp. NBC_00878]|uniref:sensor histidine kinase n=1 Tax=Streptomyces sp. NBC_00878 TaxID=2975854 RepID=UPI002257B893|nr:HAMP domain-containing sensor histidine kinase [Streptomyces sp. NBC_00878]MCX4903716.1 HAMP domain-containing histidine kinase [Streptomyces sp. NBC_00878]
MVRLLVASVLIAVCAVAATAWLAARTTSSAIQQEQGQLLSSDAEIYDTLVGYAAAHPDWDGVGPTLRRLAERTGRRITLTTQNRRPIAASTAVTVASLPARASAVVDPLHTDPALLPGAETNGIDPRAVGPYRLTTAEREALSGLADEILACLGGPGRGATLVQGPSGRPTIKLADSALDGAAGNRGCGLAALATAVPTEREPLIRLNATVNDCLRRRHLDTVKFGVDFILSRSGPPAQSCLDTARRDQLTPYVAPAALLFVTTPTGSAAPVFHLSSANTARIAGVAGLVLLVTVAVTVVVGIRLVRPLRALADAARRPVQEHQRVPVTTNDEIGYLAAAFNDLSQRRERMEDQRKAMVSDVAHELRTPLSAIRSWLEAVQDGVATSDQALIDSLLEEALLLQHIVDDLQDLAEADAGQLRIHPEPLRVRDLLDHVATAHQGRAETAGVALTTRTDGDPELCGDPVRLRQVVGNLVSNAVRHTPPGGSVALRARRAGDQVTIEVADTGTGIPAEDLPRVFDRFWRAEKSRSRRTGGSGLGLAIVRRLTEAHGGTVTVTSTVGAGTVFTIRLPT